MAIDAATLCTLPAGQRFEALGSSRDGLAGDEVERRLERYGPNAMRRARARSWARGLVANSVHPLALLLWFGAVMAFAARAPELALAVVAVVAIYGLFAVLQEHRAEQVVESLLARAALTRARRARRQ